MDLSFGLEILGRLLKHFKKPTLHAVATVHGSWAHPTNKAKNTRDYDYRLTIILENRSDLNAYSVTLEKLDFTEDRISSFASLNKEALISIKSGESKEFLFSFTVVLPIDVNSESKNAKDRLVELNNRVSFTVKFEGERRKFERHLKIPFQKTDGFEFFVI